MTLLLKGGRVVDPSRKADGKADLLIEDGKIVDFGKALPKGKKSSAAEVLDLRGKWVVPGLIDMHTHLREPGFEYKETIASGRPPSRAAFVPSPVCPIRTP
jgi:dihydroorotase